MSTVKTAISLPRALFEQIATLAEVMKVPRSRLVAQALEAFLRRHESEQMKRQLDAAYGEDHLDAEERALEHQRRRTHRDLVQSEW